MRDVLCDESPALPPSYADAFLRLLDVGDAEATASTATANASDESSHHDLAERLDVDVAEEQADDDRRAVSSAHTSDPRGDRPLHLSAETPGGFDERRISRATGRRVHGGDAQRVVIRLAPHLLSDGLVANLDDGTWVAPETWRRVACDCALDLVKVDEEGAVLDVGRRTRTIPPAIARALHVRDGGRCRFPGCTHRRFLHRHHIEHWSRGGETKLDNLITLCSAHHQLVHEGGWRVEWEGDDARFFAPDGSALTWPRPPRADDAVGDLSRAQAALDIGPTTGLTSWTGQRPEYAWCVEAVFEIRQRHLEHLHDRGRAHSRAHPRAASRHPSRAPSRPPARFRGNANEPRD